MARIKFLLTFLFIFLLLTVVNAKTEFHGDDGDYGKYEVTDWLLFKKYDLGLTRYETSVINYEIEGYIISYKDNQKVFKKLFFKDKVGNRHDFEGTYDLYINETYQWFSYIPAWDCENVTTANQTVILNCTEIQGVWIDDVKWRWVKKEMDYKFDEGEYKYLIKGERPRNARLDWVFEIDDNGDTETTDEWAWWNNSWTYKKNITSMVPDFPVFNVTYDGNMKVDFSDLRFTNEAEDTEFNYVERVVVNSSYALVTLNTTETTAYVYYGNAGANSNSNWNDTFQDPIFYANFDVNAKDQITTTAGSVNGAVQTRGNISQAYDFELGNTDYIDYGDLFDPTVDLSIVARIKLESTATGTDNWIVGKDHNTGGRAFTFGVGNNEKLRFQVDGGNNDANTVLSAGQWYTVGVTFDESTNIIAFYIDGTNTFNNSEVKTIPSTTASLNIGRRSYTGAEGYYDGIIDEVMIYDRVLSAKEMESLYEMHEQTPTFGAEESSAVLNINLIEPDNNYLDNDGSIFFNCTCTDDTGCIRLNMTIDGQEVNTTTGPGNTNLSISFLNASIPDGVYVWNCSGESLSMDANSSNYNFFVDTTPPNITITSPPNGTVITQYNQSFYLNWTITESNPDDCWYILGPTDQEINQSITLPGGFLNHYYNYSTNTYHVAGSPGFTGEGDLYFTSEIPSNNWVIEDINPTNITARRWSDPITVPDCSKVNYNSRNDLHYDDHVNEYYCVLLNNGSVVLNQITGVQSSNYTILKENVVTCTDNQTLLNYPISNPEELNVLLFMNDTIGFLSSDNVTVVKSTTAPVITIDSPISNYARLITGLILDLNYSFTNSTLLDECWYSYNNVNTSLTCGDNATFSYVGGVNTLTLYINDTLGNLGTQTQNWTVDLIENSQTFPASTTEGSTETFLANITLATGVIVQSVGFDYNGTEYIGEVFASGNDYIVRQPAFIIPNVNETTNQTFYFNLTLSTGVFVQLTANNVTVTPIDVDDCTTYNNTLFTFTNVDEKEQTILVNSTLEYAIEILTSDNSITLLNISNETTNNPLEICLSFNLTNNSNYLLDSIIKYTAQEGGTDYAIEYYNIDNFVLNNETTIQNITLYNLNGSQSTEFKVTYTGANFVPVADALIFVNRQYIAENTFKTVELPKTDNNGQTLVHLVRNDQIYNFVVVVNGVIAGSFSNIIAFCDDFSIGDCQIQLNGQQIGEEVYNSSEELGIIYNSPTYNNNTRFVTFSFVTSDGSVKEIFLNVTRNDVFGNSSICNSSVTSSGGSVTCQVPSYIDDTTLRTVVFVDGLQTVTDTVTLKEVGYGVYGFFVLFVYVLSLSLMFGRSKTLLILGSLLGILSGLGLGLIEGKVIGAGAIGVSITVAGILMLWKLNKEKQQ